MSGKNLLFILADQFRADCLGISGKRNILTPNLDLLASSGVRYTNAHTPVPVCAPARQALISGQHPDSIFAGWNYDFFPTPTVKPDNTWPQQLKAKGYSTAYLGKWHCSPTHPAQDFGYDTVIDWSPYKQMVKEKYLDLKLSSDWLGCNSPIPLADSQTHWLAREATNIMNDFTQKGEPWHMWVDFGIPHLPCQPSEPFSNMYTPESVEMWDGFGDEFINKPYIQKQQLVNWHTDTYQWADFAPMVARYHAMVSQLDDAIGNIINELKSTGQYDDTIIIFTSDHGDMCGSHQMLDKHYVLYDDVVRVPLIIKVPNVAPSVEQGFVSNCLDIPLTIADLFGLNPPTTAHGMRLPKLCDDVQERNYITASANGQQFGLYNSRMIKDSQVKYIWNATDVDELYDLQSDPGELKNLIAQPGYAPRVVTMRAELHRDMLAHGDMMAKSGWINGQLLDGRKI